MNNPVQPTGCAYQLKITLKDREPPIWRRVIVDGSWDGIMSYKPRWDDMTVISISSFRADVITMWKTPISTTRYTMRTSRYFPMF